MRISMIAAAILLFSWSPASAQHPLGWVSCEFKWQDAGKPANYQKFMKDCVESSQEPRRETAPRTGPRSFDEARGAPSPSNPSFKSIREEPAPVIQTSCHMDYCFWFRLKSKIMSQNRWNGEFVKVLSDQGQSFHPNGSYEEPQPITWKISSESYVFCSKVRPAVIHQDGNGWLATFLAPGNPDANPRSALDSYIFIFLSATTATFLRW
jgi:hypothetical protein